MAVANTKSPFAGWPTVALVVGRVEYGRVQYNGVNSTAEWMRCQQAAALAIVACVRQQPSFTGYLGGAPARRAQLSVSL